MQKQVALCLLVLMLFPAVSLSAAPQDFSIPNGHFYSQTAGNDGVSGFNVIDDGDARFWTEFQRLGGVAGVGYPVSQRFEWDGYVVQAMQKGVLQWRPELGGVYLVNVFDQLSSAGKDSWLAAVRSTPAPLDPSFDAGKDWPQIVAARLALLDPNPAIKATYHAASNPLNTYGLPTSKIVDNGNHFAVRLQRAVIQQWKVAVPWAAAGQVTVANGGDVLKEAGLLPAVALQAVISNGTEPTSRDGNRPRAPEQITLEGVNYYRALAGVPPLVLDASLARAAQAHANYYVQNYGDPKLSGMGLHAETAGRPGFTGTSWTDRARAAGYRGTVDENMGLVGDGVRSVNWFMETINHRWNLLSPSANALGYGMATKPAVDVFDIGFGGPSNSSSPAIYPGEGQQGVPPAASIYETPDPAPGIARPLGFPITISFGIRDAVSYSEYSLSDSAGQPVTLFTSQKSWLKSLALIPSQPLRPEETYNVRVAGTLNSKPFVKTWSFTTK